MNWLKQRRTRSNKEERPNKKGQPGPWDAGLPRLMSLAWRTVMVIGLFYMIVLICALWYFAEPYLSVQPEVKVPALTGLNQLDAATKAEEIGLMTEVAMDRSDAYPRDTVMRQTPLAGSTVRAGRVIHLQVCQGPVHVVLPDLRTLSNADAVRALANLELKPIIGIFSQSDTVPFDAVIDQSPPPGSVLEVETRVILTVCNGPTDNPPELATDSGQPRTKSAPTPVRPKPAEVPGDPSIDPSIRPQPRTTGGADSTDPLLGTDPSLVKHNDTTVPTPTGPSMPRVDTRTP